MKLATSSMISAIDEYSSTELGIDVPHESDRDEYLGFLEGKKKAAEKALNGKRAGGYATVEEEALLGMIEGRISAQKKI